MNYIISLSWRRGCLRAATASSREKCDGCTFDINFGENIPLAKESIERPKELDCNEDIFTIVSHDSDVRDGVPHFPDSLKAWKEKGWGKRLRWNFFSDLEK